MKRLLIVLLLLALIPTALAEPTAEPKTDVIFDYEALIKTPDDYIGRSYTVVGKVVNSFDMTIRDPSWVHCVGVVMLVDGRIDQSLYFIYDCKYDAPVAEGNRIRFSGRFGGVEDFKTKVGYIKMPLFVAGIVENLT